MVPTLPETPKKRFRKIVAKPSIWKSNIRRDACQSGKAYKSRRGKCVPEKKVILLKNCLTDCKMKCSTKISEQERQELHNTYYKLPNATEKRHFLINNSQRTTTVRCKNKRVAGSDFNFFNESIENDAPTAEARSRRTFSFKYFFDVNNEKIQVCKMFFLGTLAISQKPVYTAHKTKNSTTNTATTDMRGRSLKSRRTPHGNIDFAREHIHSFPRVESHYCRAKTTKEYLDSNLSIQSMYELYREKCDEQNKAPVKESMYSKIFNTEFNMSFRIPKSDVCDLCGKFQAAKKHQDLTEELVNEHTKHIALKEAMRLERDKDKKGVIPTLSFDLENVISLPRAEISSFFYLRKLNVYNLTAYYGPTKKIYCAISNETQSGRAGNDIASALIKILEVVYEENDFTDLITWSDSCVPQNRNQMMSYAIQRFLRNNPNISSITMKYSVPGHSCIQEIDNAHSQIEKMLNRSEIYSPLGLVRALLKVNRKRPFKVIQMKSEDFKNYAASSQLLNYKMIPFTNVAQLHFSQTLHEVTYKTEHTSEARENIANLKTNNLTTRRATAVRPSEFLYAFQFSPRVQRTKNRISEDKIKDIKASYPFMSLQDRTFYNSII